MEVAVLRLPHGEGLAMPSYQSDLAAGLDLPAALETPVTIYPGQIALIPTGFAFAIPAGYEGQVRPRSGLAIKHGITIVNAPGTIDADYRGEIKVGLVNLSETPFTIERGQRIAQLIIAPVVQARLVPVQALADTARGAGGFGHTGDL